MIKKRGRVWGESCEEGKEIEEKGHLEKRGEDGKKK